MTRERDSELANDPPVLPEKGLSDGGSKEVEVAIQQPEPSLAMHPIKTFVEA